MSIEYDPEEVVDHFMNFLFVSNCTLHGFNTSIVPDLNISRAIEICLNRSHLFFEDIPEKRTEICPELKWNPFIQLVCIPVLVAFGLFGNTISFLVMWTEAYRRKSYGYYLRALAIFDNLTLIISLVFALNNVTYEMHKREAELNGSVYVYTGIMSYHTSITCKLSEFLHHVVYLMSSWLVVCFTVDRFIAVCFPLLRVRYCTERSAIVTIFLVLIAVMASQTYHLVFVERLDRKYSPHLPCHAPRSPDPSVRLTYFGLNYFWFSFVLRFGLPFITIAVCNGFIIYHIQRMRKGRRLSETRRRHKASLAIYTLYAICACFVITVLPNAVISITQFTAYFINKHIDTKLFCTLRMIDMPFQVLRLVNYSANCVLYGLTGRQFRNELLKLFWYCTRQRQQDKRSALSPEPFPLRANDLLLTSRRNLNTINKK